MFKPLVCPENTLKTTPLHFKKTMIQVLKQQITKGKKINKKRTSFSFGIAITLSLLFFSSAYAQGPSTFYEAKKLLHTLYTEHPVSFYCGCTLNIIGKKLIPDLSSCGYTSRKPKDRRYLRTEYEHVMPASWLGNQRQCWKNGSRKNCRKHDLEFNKMEAEMVNLVPSIGEINRDRSNYRYGLIEGEKRQYGRSCDFEVDNKQRVAEPRDGVRGDIARIMFFMRDKYSIRLSRAQTALYAAWNKQDPIDEWERTRDRKILAIQGHSNHYITEQH